jgi:hypothetical protein
MDLSIAEASTRVDVSPQNMSRALATSIRSIMSGDAPYDRHVNGDRTRSLLKHEPDCRCSAVKVML